MYATEGRFTFTSHMPGEHIICLVGNSTAWFGGGTLVCVINILIKYCVDYLILYK